MRQCHSNKVDRPRHNPDQTVWISDGWLHRMLGCFSGYSVDDLFRFDESSLDKTRHDNIDFSSETSNATIHRHPIPNYLKQTHDNKTKWTINTTSLGGDVKTSKQIIHAVLSFVHFIVKSMSGHPVWEQTMSRYPYLCDRYCIVFIAVFITISISDCPE